VDVGERLSCSGLGQAYGKTVWFRYIAPAYGRVTFAASGAPGFNEDMAVYDGASDVPVACDDSSPMELSTRLSASVAAGQALLVQIGGHGSGRTAPSGTYSLSVAFVENRDVDGDGIRKPDDCNDLDPLVRPGAVDVPDDGVDQNCNGTDATRDVDEDGYRTPADCNDRNPTINPGAYDIPRDGINQDCRAGDSIRFDRDRDGSRWPRDCDDRDRRVRPGRRDKPGDGIDQDCRGGDAVDSDGDRWGDEVDCDDADPRTHPRARDRRGNRIDRDCNGLDGPAPKVRVRVRAHWTPFRGWTRLDVLKVVNAPRRAVVTLSCRGGGCRSRTISARSTGRPIDYTRHLQGRPLRPGSIVELRVVRRGVVGRLFRFIMGDREQPATEALCFYSRRPSAC
jgi:hypothetical protein